MTSLGLGLTLTETRKPPAIHPGTALLSTAEAWLTGDTIGAATWIDNGHTFTHSGTPVAAAATYTDGDSTTRTATEPLLWLTNSEYIQWPTALNPALAGTEAWSAVIKLVQWPEGSNHFGAVFNWKDANTAAGKGVRLGIREATGTTLVDIGDGSTSVSLTSLAYTRSTPETFALVVDDTTLRLHAGENTASNTFGFSATPTVATSPRTGLSTAGGGSNANIGVMAIAVWDSVLTTGEVAQVREVI